MRKIKLFFSIFLLGFFVISCSGPTLEEDAQKAAFLTKESMRFSMESNLQKAENCYMEVQKIMEKYRNTDEFEKFHETYNFYLQDYGEKSPD